MNKIQRILSEVRKESDSIILFTSLTGKDSILLTYYCATLFSRVECVYMYLVKDLTHVLKYQAYFERMFSNVHYTHVPHYVLTSHIKTGYMGIKQDKKQKLYNLSQVNSMMIEKYKIEWTCFGMKQNDSLNRRLQLRGYELNAIFRETRKVYPLSELSNKDVLGLIELLGLPKPVRYNSRPSQGQDIEDVDYLIWLQDRYPDDLIRTFETYPATRDLLYKYGQRKETAGA